MLPPMKRPSSRKNEADEDGEPETKKRPAASSGSMNKAINALKHGLKSSSSKKDEDDNDEESVGDDAEESHLRDKGKNLKFNSMRRSLPAHIIHLYDTEALSKPSPREFRAQVINQLFTKLKNGRYSLNAEKPMFQEAKKLYERKYGKDSETGLPKSVLKGLYFQNSESAFQEAISSGDVYVMNSEDGVEFFGFRKIEAGRERRVLLQCWRVLLRESFRVLERAAEKVLIELSFLERVFERVAFLLRAFERVAFLLRECLTELLFC